MYRQVKPLSEAPLRDFAGITSTDEFVFGKYIDCEHVVYTFVVSQLMDKIHNFSHITVSNSDTRSANRKGETEVYSIELRPRIDCFNPKMLSEFVYSQY